MKDYHNTNKVFVNQDQVNINFNNHVDSVIAEAKSKAKMGIDRFHYPTPRKQCIDVWEFIEAVSERTDDTVYAGDFDVKDGLIRFSIQTQES